LAARHEIKATNPQDLVVEPHSEKSKIACQNLCFGNQELTAQISIVYRKFCQGKWLKSGKMQIAFRNRKK
jgi:hypothetical protein